LRPAAWLARIDVPTITAARTIGEIWERYAIGCIIDVHAIAKRIVRRDVERRIEYTGYRSQRDVSNVVEKATTVGLSRSIASE